MSSPSAVVCREVFDENSQPSVEEICEYAQQLGIDPESESHLLPLARDGLMQALPHQWKAYYDEKLQTHYYYNEETKNTQWEHPLDNLYRELVKKARDASMQDDTCASVQELPTSEENTNQRNLERHETKVESDEELSTDSENQPEVKENTIHNKRLTPLGRPPLSPLTKLDKKLGDIHISPLRRSIEGVPKSKLVHHTSDKDVFDRMPFEKHKIMFKQHSENIDLKMNVQSPEEENVKLLFGSKTDKGLPLTGSSWRTRRSRRPARAPTAPRNRTSRRAPWCPPALPCRPDQPSLRRTRTLLQVQRQRRRSRRSHPGRAAE